VVAQAPGLVVAAAALAVRLQQPRDHLNGPLRAVLKMPVKVPKGARHRVPYLLD
jgi:hypothetical protein